MHDWSHADLLGCSHAIWDDSVHIIDADLLFFFISLLVFNRWHYQVSASQKLIWMCGNVNYASGFWWNLETLVLACSLRHLIQHHRHELTFFYVSSLTLNRQWCQVSASHKITWMHGKKRRVGVHDGILNLGCSHFIGDISVHVIEMDLLFSLFFIIIKSMMLQSFSFTNSDLSAWHCKLCIGVQWNLQNEIENNLSHDRASSSHMIVCHTDAHESTRFSCTFLRVT